MAGEPLYSNLTLKVGENDRDPLSQENLYGSLYGATIVRDGEISYILSEVFIGRHFDQYGTAGATISPPIPGKHLEGAGKTLRTLFTQAGIISVESVRFQKDQ